MAVFKLIEEVDALIFDLGNVIISLDDDAVLDHLSRLNGKTAKSIMDIFTNELRSVLEAYEKGNIYDKEFYESVTKSLGIDIGFDGFVSIWNATLAELPKAKLELLQNLMKSHKVYILSNTNNLHEREFNARVSKLFDGCTLDDFVHEAHYSHEMGMRKPDLDIYEALIDKHGLTPSETLFFDDKKENIEAAGQVGIQGIQLKHPDRLWDYFK